MVWPASNAGEVVIMTVLLFEYWKILKCCLTNLGISRACLTLGGATWSSRKRKGNLRIG